MKRLINSLVPLPPELANIPAILAKPWLQIDTEIEVLDGPAFDRAGNLFVTSVLDSRVFKISPDRKVTTIIEKAGLLFDGIAIHKDGRLFVTCASGNIITMDPKGNNLTYIKTPGKEQANIFNDLVFDSKGNLYVTDSRGTATNPIGGVYYLSAASNYQTMIPIYLNMAAANGIAIPPEGNGLWVTEEGLNALHRLTLLADGITLAPIGGARVVCYYTGSFADSLKVDSAGNVYQTMHGQGRIQVMNRLGIPIANILIPGRDEGKFLQTANMAFKPGSDEVYITLSGEGGAWIYNFHGLAPGLKMFSHF